MGHADGGDDAGRPGAGDQRVELRARLRSGDRKELWRIGGSSKITAPTPDLRRRAAHRGQRPRARAADLRRPARRPRRPHARRGARREQRSRRVEQDRPRLVHADAARLSRPAVRARQQRRVRRLRSDDRARRSTASGCRSSAAGSAPRPWRRTARSTSSNEDGEMLVVAAGRTFKHLATNSMGETADGDARAVQTA